MRVLKDKKEGKQYKSSMTGPMGEVDEINRTTKNIQKGQGITKTRIK